MDSGENSGAADATGALLQAKVALAVDAACREAEAEFKLANEGKARELKISRGAVVCLAKLVVDFTATLAEDLGHFQRHAKRAGISVDDVILCARKSPALKRALEDYEQVYIAPSNPKRRAGAPKPRGKAAGNRRRISSNAGKENSPGPENVGQDSDAKRAEGAPSEGRPPKTKRRALARGSSSSESSSDELEAGFAGARLAKRAVARRPVSSDGSDDEEQQGGSFAERQRAERAYIDSEDDM